MKPEIPIDLILTHKGNKYELAVAIMKYTEFLDKEADQVLLRDYPVELKNKKLLIAMYEILSGKVGFKYEEKK